MINTLPFDVNKIETIIQQYPTPFHIYDKAGIRQTAADMYKTFSWAPTYANYYAVKALPNPSILGILKDAGMGADCSSLAELLLAEKVGFSGEQIMFTSNDTTVEEFQKAHQLGAVINLDDISHITFLEESIGTLPQLISFRFNPGNERAGNNIIGTPAEAKYGLTREQLFEAYKLCQEKGVSRYGLHTMVASNELDPVYFIETARMLFAIAVELYQQYGIALEFLNLGGGFGINYTPEQTPLDITTISRGIQELYQSMLQPLGLQPKLFMECGRYVTGPHGYLISRVLHLKHTYRDYVGLDASMADLMRPGMYGAYHHITVLGKESQPATQIYDVTGSLCENNDKFAIQRPLPNIEVGDTIAVHDTGAHGHSMGFNYNGKLRSAELLLTESGDVELIRRAETMDDYFATLQI